MQADWKPLAERPLARRATDGRYTLDLDSVAKLLGEWRFQVGAASTGFSRVAENASVEVVAV